MIEVIKKTEQYINYLKIHYNNVQESWEIIKKKCQHFDFMYDDFKFWTLDTEIKRHDLSKLSKQEFVPYRIKFFPTEEEKKVLTETKINKIFVAAWNHHKKHNNHHWENWTKTKHPGVFPNDTGYVVHMVCDWMAMGMIFNDTAKDYYNKNKNKIIIPKWADEFIRDIFKSIEN